LQEHSVGGCFVPPQKLPIFFVKSFSNVE
jgi:hypothetical protein